MTLKTAALASSLLFATAASAFDIDGIRSGMTTQELQDVGARRHLQIKSGDGLNYIMGKLDTYQIDASFIVCGGRVVSYSRSIDFDADFINVLADMNNQHGQPNVKTKRTPVAESRDGKGTLKFNRGSWINYSVQNKCMQKY